MNKYQTHYFLIISVIIFPCIGCQRKALLPSVDSSPIIISSPTPTVNIVSPENRKKAAQLRQLGLEYRQQGQIKQAIKSLNESVTLDPQNLSGLFS